MSNDYYEFRQRQASDDLHSEPASARILRLQARDGKIYGQQRGGSAIALLDLTKSINNFAEMVKYTPSVHTQGDTGAASRIKILATKLDGTAYSKANHRLRVRVHNANTITASTNATIAVANSTSLLASLTANKDLIIEEAGTASLTTAQGSNQDLTYTSLLGGTSGNSTTVRYVDPGTASASLSVSVSGQAITVNLATTAGTAQVETVTVATGSDQGPTEDGTLTVVFVSADTGTVNVPVALLDADADDAATATKIRAALAATSAITDHYTIAGSGADITATKDVTAANDATLSITWGAYVAGVNAASSSTNTTAGVAPAPSSTASQIKTAIEANADASALVSVALASGSNGSGTVAALAATNLAGGDAGGDVFWIDLTNGTAETVTVEVGPAPYGEITYGDYSTKLNVTHAAP